MTTQRLRQYYHVSSKLGDMGAFPVLTRGEKPLQDVIEMCKPLKVDTYDGYTQSIILLDNNFKVTHNDSTIAEGTGRHLLKWLSEAVFEYVRMDSFRNLPSRMDGFFLLDDIEEARSFIRDYRNGAGKIYSCWLPDEEVFSFDMNLFTMVCEPLCKKYKNAGVPDRSEYQLLCDTAYEYWAQNHFTGNSKELLYEVDMLELKLVQEE